MSSLCWMTFSRLSVPRVDQRAPKMAPPSTAFAPSQKRLRLWTRFCFPMAQVSHHALRNLTADLAGDDESDDEEDDGKRNADEDEDAEPVSFIRSAATDHSIPPSLTPVLTTMTMMAKMRWLSYVNRSTTNLMRRPKPTLTASLRACWRTPRWSARLRRRYSTRPSRSSASARRAMWLVRLPNPTTACSSCFCQRRVISLR